MKYEEVQIYWSMPEEWLDDEEEGTPLSGLELSRLAFFIAHPDLADPLIWFLPVRWNGRR